MRPPSAGETGRTSPCSLRPRHRPGALPQAEWVGAALLKGSPGVISPCLGGSLWSGVTRPPPAAWERPRWAKGRALPAPAPPRPRESRRARRHGRRPHTGRAGRRRRGPAARRRRRPGSGGPAGAGTARWARFVRLSAAPRHGAAARPEGPRLTTPRPDSSSGRSVPPAPTGLPCESGFQPSR